MRSEEAITWLRRVGGQLYRNKPHPSGRNAWVAVVRAPRTGNRAGTLIIAVGSTMEEAAETAASRWRRFTGHAEQLH
ncbi:MAG: hypothetical protein QNK04_07010 [Myxococcota bacterium]|nr:hypothetical protein [Myxococcota bacterium]